MSPDEFMISCSTPKRRWTSCGRSSQAELTIEGPRRRKFPTQFDLFGNQLFPVFSGALDSPTSRQCAAGETGELATCIPNSELLAPLHPNDFTRHPSTKVEFLPVSLQSVEGTRSENAQLHPRINQKDLENNDFRRSFVSLQSGQENFPQPSGLCSRSFLRASLPSPQSKLFFPENHWSESDPGVAKSNPECSSHPVFTAVPSISDSIPSQDYVHTTAAIACAEPSHFSQNQNQAEKKCTETVLKNFGSRPEIDDDLYRLFNAPLLSIGVTNQPHEGQNIVDIIRRESLKRKLSSRDREIWSEKASRAFDEAVKVIPRLGRAKALALTLEGPKPFGRNELIADYIYRRTGMMRDRKQVSSHIQVIKNSRKMETSPESIGPSSAGNKSSFDACSASWFGAFITNGVLTLYPCTPEFPFASRVLQHQAPPKTEAEFTSFLKKVSEVRKSKPAT